MTRSLHIAILCALWAALAPWNVAGFAIHRPCQARQVVRRFMIGGFGPGGGGGSRDDDEPNPVDPDQASSSTPVKDFTDMYDRFGTVQLKMDSDQLKEVNDEESAIKNQLDNVEKDIEDLEAQIGQVFKEFCGLSEKNKALRKERAQCKGSLAQLESIKQLIGFDEDLWNSHVAKKPTA